MSPSGPSLAVKSPSGPSLAEASPVYLTGTSQPIPTMPILRKEEAAAHATFAKAVHQISSSYRQAATLVAVTKAI
eukprot:6829647-Prymnesium_polylepis.1